jgi:ribosomal protein L11 methylase PrmA
LWSIFIPAGAQAMDSLSGELWELGTAGLVEEAAGLRAFFDDSIKREGICARFETAWRSEAPFDDSKVRQLECDPLLIGERFFVAPSCVTEPTPAGRFRLSIDATRAFGSGRHESTQLCIEALEKHLTPGDVVLDIGCGSGILASAAMLLGAKTVFSCDIHADSVGAARALTGTPIFVGSADGIRSHSGDLILANISAKVLDRIAGDLRRVCKPAGKMILSGFIRENPPKRFEPREVREKGDWQCWVCRREDIEAAAEAGEPAAHAEQWWL